MMKNMGYDPKIVAERIKAERKRKGWTQKQLATESTVSYNSIQNYEGARRVPDSYNLNLIAKVLRVDPFYLLGETDFRNIGEKFDSKLKEELPKIQKDVKFWELAEELYPEWYQAMMERKENMKTRDDVKVIINENKNQIIENFETGEITIYATSDSQIEKAFRKLVTCGIIAE